jgi:RNA polymerase sigma-70 factor (ECF subfamily)
MTPPDGDLVRRCLRGEEDAFRALVQRHEHPVYSLIWRMVNNAEDARDLTQEAFVRAFRALDQFDVQRPFSFWINRIASNVAIDFLRRRRLRTVSIDVDPEEQAPIHLVDHAPLADQQLDQGRRKEVLDAAVQRLPEHYRVVVHLRYAQQRSYEEIAEMLDLPLGTVKARLHRAHQHLRGWLQGEQRSLGLEEADV